MPQVIVMPVIAYVFGGIWAAAITLSCAVVFMCKPGAVDDEQPIADITPP